MMPIVSELIINFKESCDLLDELFVEFVDQLLTDFNLLSSTVFSPLFGDQKTMNFFTSCTGRFLIFV